MTTCSPRFHGRHIEGKDHVLPFLYPWYLAEDLPQEDDLWTFVEGNNKGTMNCVRFPLSAFSLQHGSPMADFPSSYLNESPTVHTFYKMTIELTFRVQLLQISYFNIKVTHHVSPWCLITNISPSEEVGSYDRDKLIMLPSLPKQIKVFQHHCMMISYPFNISERV